MLSKEVFGAFEMPASGRSKVLSSICVVGGNVSGVFKVAMQPVHQKDFQK